MPIREPEGQRRLARTDPEPAHTRATMALRPICLGTHSDAGRARSGEGAPTGRGAERPSYGQSDRESSRGDDSGCGGGNGGSGRVVDGLGIRAGRVMQEEPPVHSADGVFDWRELDANVTAMVQLGLQVMLFVETCKADPSDPKTASTAADMQAVKLLYAELQCDCTGYPDVKNMGDMKSMLGDGVAKACKHVCKHVCQAWMLVVDITMAAPPSCTASWPRRLQRWDVPATLGSWQACVTNVSRATRLGTATGSTLMWIFKNDL